MIFSFISISWEKSFAHQRLHQVCEDTRLSVSFEKSAGPVILHSFVDVCALIGNVANVADNTTIITVFIFGVDVYVVAITLAVVLLLLLRCCFRCHNF